MSGDPTPFTVCIDWLQVSVRVDNIERLRSAISHALQVQVTDWRNDTHGGLGYERSQSVELVNSSRATIYWTPETNDHPARPECHARLSGKACALIQEPGSWHRFLTTLAVLEARPARLDLTGDDRCRTVDPAFVYQEYRRGAAVTHALRTDWIESHEANESLGATFYLGSPRSDLRLCVYDKTAESSHRIDAIRWELRCRNDSAQAVFNALLERPEEEWGDVFCGALVRFVDWREPESYGKANKHRRQRCAWFEHLVGAATAARLLTTEVVDVQTIVRFIAWVERSLAGSLHAYQQLMGSESVGRLLRAGSLKIGARHRQMIELARKAGQQAAQTPTSS